MIVLNNILYLKQNLILKINNKYTIYIYIIFNIYQNKYIP